MSLTMAAEVDFRFTFVYARSVANAEGRHVSTVSIDLATDLATHPSALTRGCRVRRGLEPASQPAHAAWEVDAADGDPSELAEDRLAQLASALGPPRRVPAALGA